MTVGGLLAASLFIPLLAASYVENVAANVDVNRQHKSFLPLVAFDCGFRNQYLDESGVWVTDKDRYATCQSGKYDVLKYCKKAYPKLNVTNIVEYSHEVRIENWCREEGSPCNSLRVVRPYQCIVGEFRSEALQVPHDCKFSHVNSRDQCNDYPHWKSEAKKICQTKMFDGKKMAMRSFAVLEPCGLDMFTGVEFVCCPSESVGPEKIENFGKKSEKAAALPLEDDEDSEDDDDYTESDEDDDDEIPSVDPYLKKVDASNEHESYRDALQRLETKHKKKVEEVMNEWAELEERYAQMKNVDPKGAEKFKASMSNRFQKTVASLEDEHKKGRRELKKVHDDRVIAFINEKKRDATHEYRQALAAHVKSPNKARVLRALKSYIRFEEKDRVFTLNKYRQLLKRDPEEAKVYKQTVLHKLRYIDLRINGTLAMHRDIPDVEAAILPIALEFWSDYRREHTPDLSDSDLAALNTLDPNAKNKKLVDLYTEAVEKLHPSAKLDVKAPPPTTTTTEAPKASVIEEEKSDSEEDNDPYYEDEDDEERQKPPKPVKTIVTFVKKEEVKTTTEVAKELARDEDESFEDDKKTEKTLEEQSNSDESDESDDDGIIEEDTIKNLRVNIEPIIDEKPSFYRHEKFVQHQRTAESGSHAASSQAMFVFGALFIVVGAILVVHMIKKHQRHNGFIEVDVCTPEERHISGMQVNGYENPTYSFFDSKA